MMSRLIIKNLPDISKEELKEHFSSKGEVTDVKLHFTRKGVFRRFGFVGYKTVEEAQNALKYFNKSFIKTNKLVIETAKDLGDENVSRPWSKYSSKSSAFQRSLEEKEKRLKKIRALQGLDDDEESSKKNKTKRNRKSGNVENTLLEELDEAEKDPDFVEFLKIHQSSKNKQTWDDDVIHPQTLSEKNSSETKKMPMDKSQGKKTSHVTKSATKIELDKSDDEQSSDEEESEDNDLSETVNTQQKGSDLTWLKSKTTTVEDVQDTLSESGESNSDGSTRNSSSEEDSSPNLSTAQKSCKIKLRGLPFKCEEKDIITFLAPIKIIDIRFFKNKERKATGIAFVTLDSPKSANKALKKSGSYIGKRYIEVSIVEDKKSVTDTSRLQKWIEKSTDEQEPISESGRLFIRNLSFTCIEEELDELFGKYGPLAEVHIPIDKTTMSGIGIGYVTFMMPEHAVLAYNNLDGKVFQGRFLHILPADAKREVKEDAQDNASSFKQKKEKKLKSTSSSSHNWNTLFLGQNTVADVMADRLKTSKSKVLGKENTDSVAVRMALGETQLVSETREFLTNHGVRLDVFGQAKTKRSKTVIIAKNLPTGTSYEELTRLFEKHGQVQRIVLPPTCITALIEFLRPSEAKEAFQHLAYSKFKYLPLYLEWAPVDVFMNEPVTEKKIEEKEEVSKKEISEDKGSGGTGSCVLFVKNLNFQTTEQSLEKKFTDAGFTVHVTVAKKKDAKKSNSLLSMGYGFIEFYDSKDANDALIKMQHCELEGHKLELKRSDRPASGAIVQRQKAIEKEPTGCKILVRNIPFEANKKEIKELFGAFGELKNVRLPQKVSGTGSHRGFAFIEFLTKQDAKRAFTSLCQSTHLYGRRLVLEWAENEDTVDNVRKRTIKHYHQDNKLKKKKREFIEDIDKALTMEE